MAQEQISKINALAIIGPLPGTETISKIVIYAIINSSSPTPPPPVARRRTSVSLHYGAMS